MWVQSLGLEVPLEEERATHSNLLAWKIRWTEEPARLQSTGLQSDMTESTYTHIILKQTFIMLVIKIYY